MDKIYKSVERINGSVSSSRRSFSLHSVFHSAAVLSRMQYERIEKVRIEGDEKLCVMVVLMGTNEIFEQMIREMPEVDADLKQKLHREWE